MAKYKLKKGQKIGSLSAEADNLLKEAFVDVGYLDLLLDVNDPRFLVIGRTGSGKTALLKMIEDRVEHISRIDPEDLSMQYLHSNSILNLIADLGVHLDIFFKYLWRHICILELIKIRYKDSKESKVNLLQLLFTDEKKVEQHALRYLAEHGDHYWITADTHIKNFTTELETKVTEDAEIGAKVKTALANLSAKIGSSNEQFLKEGVMGEVINRTQSIVNDYQIAALNEIMNRLSSKSFKDGKNRYYIIIDDLDKNWMPNDRFYIVLIKSLLYTVRELNQKMNGVKIIIALRTNIYYRIFKKSQLSEPQREKWADVIVDLHWEKEELIQLVNRRLSSVLRDQYTNEPPELEDILPHPKKKIGTNAFDYILDRTFYRPRDVIEFINLAIEENELNVNLIWTSILKAELEYSKNRLNSILDEWRDSFYGIPSTFVFLIKYPAKFRFNEISDDDVLKIFEYRELNKCNWLFGLYTSYCNDVRGLESIKLEILNVLYLTGIIGMKYKNEGLRFSYSKPIDLNAMAQDEIKDISFVVHKMFWKALGINQE